MIRISKVDVTPETTAEVAHVDELCFPPPLDTAIGAPTPNTHRWLARELPGGRVVGFLSIEYRTGERIGIIDRVAVLPSHRGHRLQCRMQNAAIRWAETQRWLALSTYTLAYNHPSSNSLAACKFKIYTPGGPWVGTVGVIYWYRKIGK